MKESCVSGCVSGALFLDGEGLAKAVLCSPGARRQRSRSCPLSWMYPRFAMSAATVG